MPPFIVIVGDIPEADLRLIKSAAEENDIGVELKKSAEELGKSYSDIAVGYISYLPCTPESILDLFSNIPIGANEYFPLYQVVDDSTYPEILNNYPVTSVFKTPITPISLRNIFNTIQYHQSVSEQVKGIVNEILKYRKQKHQLVELSTALSKHHELDTLLSLILNKSCDIMNADAGSIYIRERQGPGRPFTNKLRFKVSHNYSVEFITSEEFTIDIDKNRIAGYVAATGENLNIKDAYKLDDSVPYKFSKDFDERFNYRMKSMLTVPLNNIEGEVVGILQLMNKKKDPSVKLTSPEIVLKTVVNFSYSDEIFLQSIGALAAVSIERTQLYESIEHIFEGFLSSSIAAIDERDRVTSGHSRRVMGYVMAFIEAINKCNEGSFKNMFFPDDQKRQFKFAALLHDIGKIGVPEGLLNKEHRLPKGEFAAVLSRFDTIRFQLISNKTDKKLSWSSLEEVENDRLFLERVNKSGFISDEDFTQLLELKEKCYTNSYGEEVPLITEEEFEALSVRRGNLTEEEREIINSHTVSSQRILSKISWTPDLERIPDIAAHHHERLDGTGYPDGLKKEQIQLEEKILSVVDVYDAIVAQDRPYKPAMPPLKAIDILRAEARAGRLDPDVVDFFVTKDIYKTFSD